MIRRILYKPVQLLLTKQNSFKKLQNFKYFTKIQKISSYYKLQFQFCGQYVVKFNTEEIRNQFSKVQDESQAITLFNLIIQEKQEYFANPYSELLDELNVSIDYLRKYQLFDSIVLISEQIKEMLKNNEMLLNQPPNSIIAIQLLNNLALANMVEYKHEDSQDLINQMHTIVNNFHFTNTLVEAEVWYAQGTLLDSMNEYKSALDSFEKGLQIYGVISEVSKNDQEKSFALQMFKEGEEDIEEIKNKIQNEQK